MYNESKRVHTNNIGRMYLFQPKDKFQNNSWDRMTICGGIRFSIAAIVILLLSAMIIVQFSPKQAYAEPETRRTSPSITISSDGGVSFEVLPSIFNSSSETISIFTSYPGGYTLSMQTAGASTALVGESGQIPTILSNDLAENEIDNAYGFTFTDYRQELYQPVPVLNASIQLAATNSANQEADSYELTFGARVGHTIAPGSYSNTFSIVAVVNSIDYTINYLPNAGEDTVLGMPSPATQTATISGDGLVLSDAVPTRANYVFMGWSESPSDSANIYSAGETFIPQSWDDDEFTLYAIWRQTGIIYNANGGTFANSAATNWVVYDDACNTYRTSLNKNKAAIEGSPILTSTTNNIDPSFIDATLAGEEISPEQVTGYYENNLEAFDVMTFPGASQVMVHIYYNVPDSNDMVGVVSGAVYSASEVYEHQENIQAMYSDTGAEVQQDHLIIEGDTVTLGISSNGSISGLGYAAMIAGIAPDDGSGDGELNYVPGYHITNSPNSQVVAISDNVDFEELYQEFSTTGTYSGPAVAAPSTDLSFETISFPGAQYISFEGILWDAGSDGSISLYVGEVSTLEDAASATLIGTLTGSGANVSAQTIPFNQVTIVYNNPGDGWYAGIFMGYDSSDSNVTGYQFYTAATISGTRYCAVEGSYQEPSYTGRAFLGWSTDPTATEVTYIDEKQFIRNYLNNNPDTPLTLYAVWDKYYTIHYNGNGNDAGSMLHLTQGGFMRGENITLYASNFSRSGYGFAGWEDENDRHYGPNQTITVDSYLLSLADEDGDITLYADWVQSSGYLQNWNGCSSLNLDDVIALTDSRDGDTYAVAKLYDGRCWIIENLRLDNTADFADTNKSDGRGGKFIGLANPEPVTNFGSALSNSLYNYNSEIYIPRYNNINTNQTALDPSSGNENIYSYGNYYSWPAAAASTILHGFPAGYWEDEETWVGTPPSNIAETSICPSGWTLPTYGELTTLDSALGGTSELQNTMAASNRWRRYPNNFIYSGRLINPTISARGGGGFFWSSNAESESQGSSAHAVTIGNEIVNPRNYMTKNYGFSVRCIANSNRYTITFDANTEDTVSGDMPKQYARSGNSTRLRKNTFKRSTATTTYEFIGWSTSSGQNDVAYSDEDQIDNVNSNTTLYAQWGTENKLLEIIYDGNGATSGSTATQYIAENSSDYLYTNGFSRTGYAFLGWNTKSDGSGTSYAQSSTYSVGPIELGDSITLYAQWSAGLTIIFDGNGSTSGSTNTQVIPAGVSANLNSNGFSRTGYKFKGWNTEPDGSGTSYSNNGSFTAPASTVVGDTQDLYAQWESVYSIRYDGNGATGGRAMNITNDNVAINSSVVLYAPNYSNPGHGFAGWAVNSSASPDDGISIIYGPNETIVFTQDLANFADQTRTVTLYAIWVAAEIDQNENPIYLQDFDTNACATINIGEVIALTDKRDNDTYAITKLPNGLCWMMENLRLDDSAELSTSNTNNPALPLINSYGGNTTSNHLSTSTNTWCSSIDSSCTVAEADENCVNQSQINTNNMSEVLSSSPDANYDVAYGEEMYSWYAYGTMYSWYSATAGNGTYSTIGDVSGDICPAGWHLINSSVRGLTEVSRPTQFPFNLVFSGRHFGSQEEYRGSSGYYWAGYGQAIGDNQQAAGAALGFDVSSSGNPHATSTGASIGMAVRCITGNEYYIQNYDANGLTFTNSSTSNVTVYTYDKDSANWDLVTGTYEEPLTTEYQDFIGWSTNSSSTTAEYASELDILHDMLSGNKTTETYYAIWHRLAKVIYDGNGDDDSSNIARYVADGDTESVGNDINFEKSGYAITSWNTEPDGSGMSIPIGYNYQYNSSDNPGDFVVTLYAQWEPGFTVSYDGNGADTGTMGSTAVPDSSGEITLAAPNFLRFGYGFAGWSATQLDPDNTNFANDLATTTVYGPNSTIETSSANFGTAAPASITLYAVWVPVATDANDSELTFQTSNLASITLPDGDTLSDKSIGYVTALKDERDDQVYAIAKLADGNYWMIENLRLPSSQNINITTSNTHSPTHTFIYTDLANILNGTDTEFWKPSNYGASSSLFDRLSVGLGNVLGTDVASFNNDSQNSPWRSYGVMYNWYTATAGNGTYEDTSGSESGDICPAGWHLPSGTSTGEFGILSNALGGYQLSDVAQTMDSSTTPTGATMSNILRSYPNNFVYSGKYDNDTAPYRGSKGIYWSSDSNSNMGAFTLYFDTALVYPANFVINDGKKGDGLAVRCLIN